MKIEMTWTSGMKLEATADGHTLTMDAKSPIGQGSAMTPKELVAAGLGGCTAMDVAALFKKHKQTVESFSVDVDVEMSKNGAPVVFTRAMITYWAEGPIEPEIFTKAVTDSQNKYCGVSAMLSKSFPIYYTIMLNGEKIGDGQSHADH